MDHDLLSPLRDSRANADPDWEVMEARLLEAFAAQRADPKPAITTRSREWRRWVAAAAAVVMAAAITFYTVPSRYVRPQPQADAPPPAAPAARTEPAREAPPASPAPQQPAPPAQPRPRAASPRVAAPAEARFNEFVPLPGAFALPDFESGRIVRMEVPLAGLPAYGIDLVPDAAPAAVEADFLVGQDGLPRAIRLASIRMQ